MSSLDENKTNIKNYNKIKQYTKKIQKVTS